MEYRRFGKTEIRMPVISCGGMRFQQSWKDTDPVSEESQRNLEACVRRALELGINHFETARGYGTSEYQLGKILPHLKRDEIIVQTKVAGNKDTQRFRETLEKSFALLRLDYWDLFAFHGINTEEELEATLQCLDIALEWQRQGRIRHIGFSTHGSTEVIIRAIQTGVFSYVNLHWYYIFQDNWPAVVEARKRDMGVFIISPNDKGGLLYKPSAKLTELCAPLHPMVFNGLFCLMHPEVHTLSCGAARPEDFDIHMETVRLLPCAQELVEPIVQRLEQARRQALGEDWAHTWHVGLPPFTEAPNQINVPVILRLWNLCKAFDMVEYGRMRYNLLGNGGTWFPGQKAENALQIEWSDYLRHSPHAARIPHILAEAHAMLVGEERKRLQQED